GKYPDIRLPGEFLIVSTGHRFYGPPRRRASDLCVAGFAGCRMAVAPGMHFGRPGGCPTIDRRDSIGGVTMPGRARLRTPVCDVLGCDYPIISAGMGGVARAELVAAVLAAGGYGALGMVRESPELIAREVAAV